MQIVPESLGEFDSLIPKFIWNKGQDWCDIPENRRERRRRQVFPGPGRGVVGGMCCGHRAAEETREVRKTSDWVKHLWKCGIFHLLESQVGKKVSCVINGSSVTSYPCGTGNESGSLPHTKENQASYRKGKTLALKKNKRIFIWYWVY